MRFTCDPSPMADDSMYCLNWNELRFTIDGRDFPAWRVRLADDVQGILEVFMINPANEYILAGIGTPPGTEILRGKVEIIGPTCKMLTKCEQKRMAKKHWWTALKRN